MLKRSAIGFAAGALCFALLGMYLNVSIGAPALSNPGPVAILALIGGTIAGLIAPLIRRPGRDRDEASGPAE